MRGMNIPDFTRVTLQVETGPESYSDIGIVLMDFSWHPIAADEGALTILCGDGVQSGADADPVPRLRLAADIVDGLRPDLSGEPSPLRTDFRIGHHFYDVRAFVVTSPEGTSKRGFVVLRLERRLTTNDAVSRLCRDYHVTEREEEALRGVAMGFTSKELADRMNIRDTTVKTFLRLLMIKMGVASRAGIVAKLLDYNDDR